MFKTQEEIKPLAGRQLPGGRVCPVCFGGFQWPIPLRVIRFNGHLEFGASNHWQQHGRSIHVCFLVFVQPSLGTCVRYIWQFEGGFRQMVQSTQSFALGIVRTMDSIILGSPANWLTRRYKCPKSHVLRMVGILFSDSTTSQHNESRHLWSFRVHALQRAMDPASSGAAPKRSSKRKLKVKGQKLQELGVVCWECLEYPACHETSSLGILWTCTNLQMGMAQHF